MSRFKIVFMGTPEFAVPSLNALAAGPDLVAAVVTQPDGPRGRGRRLVPSVVKSRALELGIPVIQPPKARDAEFIKQMEALGPDLFVVAAFGQILPQRLLDIPTIMPVNVHGSLLPAYRGAAPVQWAIIHGLRRTGITIMKMDAGMDTGPILLQDSLEIGEEETFGELYPRMAGLGADLLMKALAALDAGTLEPVEQPSEGVCMAPMLTREMARVQWDRPAVEVHNLVRALDPSPGAYTMLGDERLRLYRPSLSVESGGGQAPWGTVVYAGDRGLEVACGRGSVIFREVQWPGKRRMEAGAFLRGRSIAPGTRLI